MTLSERIHINDIYTSRHNVRKRENPAKDMLRLSLEAHGFKGVLEVKKVGTGFEVTSGGNTRVEILKELYAETSDPLYAHINCEITNPTHEDTVIAHLIENDARGDLTFCERVCAVGEIIDSQRSIQKKLTAKALAAHLNNEGYSLSQSIAHWILYAHDNIKDAMPNIFENIGRPAIEKHSKLTSAFLAFVRTMNKAEDDNDGMKAARKLWSQVDKSTKGKFDFNFSKDLFASFIAENTQEPDFFFFEFNYFCLEKIMDDPKYKKSSEIDFLDLMKEYKEQESENSSIPDLINEIFELADIHNSKAKNKHSLPLGTVIEVPPEPLTTMSKAIIWFSVASLINITGSYLYGSEEKIISHLQNLELADSSYRPISLSSSTYQEFISSLKDKVYSDISHEVIEQSLVILITRPSNSNLELLIDKLIKTVKAFKRVSK